MTNPMLELERRFAWSFAGFVLGTVSLVLAVLVFYVGRRDARTDLKVLVEEEANLVQVREQIPRLQILYDGSDIIGANREIKVLRIKVQNDGATILQGWYDQRTPFGLRFDQSVLLGVALLDSNSQYLRENLQEVPDQTPAASSTNQQPKSAFLEFNKVIFEKGKFVRLKVFLLQDKGVAETPVTATGKISGLDAVPVLRSEPDRSVGKSPMFSSAFVVGFLVVGYFGFIGIMIGIVFLTDWIGRHKRSRTVANFLSTRGELTEEQRRIVESYQSGWPIAHARLVRAILRGRNTLDLSDFVKNEMDEIVRKAPRSLLLMVFPRRMSTVSRLSLMPEIFQRDGISVSLNPANREFITAFAKFCGHLKDV